MQESIVLTFIFVRLMNRWVAFLLLFSVFPVALWAQKNQEDLSSIPDIHKLGPVDSALMELYRDSFENDLINFLSIFQDPKARRADTVYSMDRSSHAEVALGFASRNMVYGRDIGISGVGFYPSIDYYHKYGFFAGFGLTLYTDPAIENLAPVPAVALYAGFRRTFFKRWFLEASYTRTFLTYGSVESKNMLINDFAFASSVDCWKRLIFSFSAYVDWSSLSVIRGLPLFERRSYEIPLSLRKEFIIYDFIGARIFTITPIITAYFATDNFAFIRQRAVAEETGGKLSYYTTSVDHFFGFVDVEPSLSLDWRIRNVDIFALPALAIPFNTFDYQTGSRVKNPKEYEFYVQAGVKYLFHLNKIRKQNKLF